MLKFATFSSDIELPFYSQLASYKINHDKLDDSARRLLGLYELRPTDAPEASCRMQVHGSALTSDEVPTGLYRAEGIIKNVNTIEEYLALDRTALLNQAARTIWDAINDGTIYSCPSLLASFTVICYADLKKYRFTYHFGFPALHSESPWKLATKTNLSSDEHTQTEGQMTPHEQFTGEETIALVDSVQTWRYAVDARQYGFFLAKRVHGKRLEDGSTNSGENVSDDLRPMTPGTPGLELGFAWVVGSLASFEGGFFNGVDQKDRFVCFADPSTYPGYPGWMLRNLLILVRQRWKLKEVQILCYRDVQARRHEARSIILNIQLDPQAGSDPEPSLVAPGPASTTIEMPRVTGWERNAAGKLKSKMANLAESMDPQRLADQAVDLNLKLIKWRIAPGLDLEIIKDTKCLLLGAGTLGSYVARNLLGWGFRKITFVDSGSVSFSNPVRQPLFNFNDCLSGGAKKAIRASEALTEIYPGVDTKGHVLSVPMAGHPIMDDASVKSDFESLHKLIGEHDVIFLLTDSRESRWLPTVMSKAAGKTVMNAALGFDTFVVMRHGLRDENTEQELGCYFCNDVVAPADSLSDRTLDQQCTVTRPGLAAIASALLVEVLVCLIQHPLGAKAPASQTDDYGSHPLGIVPHQIRGFLSTFRNMSISGKSYDCCSACSPKVLEAYEKNGWDFVQRALNEKGYVEELSGLAEVQRAAEKAAADVEWEEEGSAVEEGEGELV